MTHETLLCFGGPLDGQWRTVPARTKSLPYVKPVNVWEFIRDPSLATEEPVETQKGMYYREAYSTGAYKVGAALVDESYPLEDIMSVLDGIAEWARMAEGQHARTQVDL